MTTRPSFRSAAVMWVRHASLGDGSAAGSACPLSSSLSKARLL